jgi:hypothetical protein
VVSADTIDQIRSTRGWISSEPPPKQAQRVSRGPTGWHTHHTQLRGAFVSWAGRFCQLGWRFYQLNGDFLACSYAALEGLCEGTRVRACDVCAGQHQHQLRDAHCTTAAIEAWCARRSASMRGS